MSISLIHTCTHTYTQGFQRPHAYIATQGPLSETVADFWQMVWEQNSEIIVMISNFVERGRSKCEMYWPHNKILNYGCISVRQVFQKEMAFYTERRFRIRNIRNKKVRQRCHTITNENRFSRIYIFVAELEGTHGVPLPIHGLARFRCAAVVAAGIGVREGDHQALVGIVGPDSRALQVDCVCVCVAVVLMWRFLVRCSAGVGRTGTYICIESQIRKLDTEHQINVRGFLEHIRQQRMKLVQTEVSWCAGVLVCVCLSGRYNAIEGGEGERFYHSLNLVVVINGSD